MVSDEDYDADEARKEAYWDSNNPFEGLDPEALTLDEQEFLN